MKNYKETLSFDNSWVDASLPTTSISTILTMVQEPFDSRAIAEKTYNKRFNDPNSEYYQMTVEQIMENWEQRGKKSMSYGRLLDEYIGIKLKGDEDDLELYRFDNDVDNDEHLKLLNEGFDKFDVEHPNFEFVDRERTLFYKVGDQYVKGRFDALFHDENTNKWVVVDWKSSGSVDTKPTIWTTKLLGAAKEFDALNWYTYTMQTYFYKTALVESGYLPEGTTYDDIDVMIVNIPGKVDSDNNPVCLTYGPAFEYNKDTMDKIFNFGIKKNILLEKKNNKK